MVSSILEIAHAKAVKAQGEGRMPQMVKSFLKPLRERRSHRIKATELVAEPGRRGTPVFPHMAVCTSESGQNEKFEQEQADSERPEEVATGLVEEDRCGLL